MQTIDEPELDKNVNKRFLKMKANDDKPNFRSPFTSILWPSGTKTYILPRAIEIERDLNVYLGRFQKIYYIDGLVSGYVKEFKEKDITLNIGTYRKKEESMDGFHLSCSYKVFFSISMSQTDTSKTNQVSLKVEAVLTYSISYEFPALKEKTALSGQLKLQTFRNEHDFNDNMSNEYIIETAGSQFEKHDSRLRYRLKQNVSDLLIKKSAALMECESLPQEKIALIHDDLRKLEKRFVEDDKIVQHNLRIVQGS